MRVKCRLDGELQGGRRHFAAVHMSHPAEITGRLYFLIGDFKKMKFNTRLLVRLALFSAISLVLGKYLQIPVGDSIRISFENLTIILAGYLYGPLCGALCGTVADLVGCMLVGYAINPIITFGAAAIGFLSGLFGKHGIAAKSKLWLSVVAAHTVGSVVIKSAGLYLYFATPLPVLALRLPTYLIVGTLEYMLIRFFINHRGLRELL